MGLFFPFPIIPQELEKLGVLPIKLRGGSGQPPETWNQVPQGSTYIKVPLLKVQVPKVPHQGSTLKSPGSPRFHIKVPLLKVQVPQGIKVPLLKVRVAQGSTSRFHS